MVGNGSSSSINSMNGVSEPLFSWPRGDVGKTGVTRRASGFLRR